ncbi:response regulator transcription factor [Idiomarina xiamenensis]|uniref:Response regulator receiver protein n=1 Tax=Idiomarina xiamenensis 10-D-4 TaxID=740709 RepID=K2J9K9_9GAMM|nr:response regulator [Idiomarina xiamenensis]EKE79946.1 response regulator receiver protein [Idiomarina xiamenensis 10-D-4]
MTRLVLIDDDDAFRDVLARRLQHHQYAIQAYADPVQALAQPELSVHAVLLDMRLADSSGLDAIAPLQQHFRPRHFIMLTGYASIATTVEAMRRGATDYLAKPVALTELLARLQQDSSVQREAQIDDTPMTPAQVEWEHIQRVLLAHQGNVSATAEALGMHRRSLQRKLQKHAPFKR